MSAASILFVGGSRSGKSGLAQRWAEARASQRLYLATGRADDAEMTARIARHQAERGPGWGCLEEPSDPVAALAHTAISHAGDEKNYGVVLLDCVSLWIANLMEQELPPNAILERVEKLAVFIAAAHIPLALVSAETGMGMVAMSSVGRCFQDTLGLANQILAKACHTVLFVSCGLPLPLKGEVPKELC